MNYNISIVRKPGSKRLYTSYMFQGQRIEKSTGLIDTPANRKHITNTIIPAYIAELVAGRNPAESARTLSYYLDRVIEKAKTSSTIDTYKSAKDTLLYYLKDRPMNFYKVEHIEDMIKEMETKKKETGKKQKSKNLTGYSQRTIETYLAPLSKAFKDALKNDEKGVTKNIVSLLDREKKKKENKASFTQDETIRIINAAEGEFKKFLLIAFFVGLRHGEILGLTWEDLNESRSHITVNKQFNIKYKQDNAPTKINRYVESRNAPVPEIFWNMMRHYERTDLYIVDRTGMDESKRDWIRKNFKTTLQKANIDANGRTPYCTRHTFISLGAQSGENPLLLIETVGQTDLKQMKESYGTLRTNTNDYQKFSQIFEGKLDV